LNSITGEEFLDHLSKHQPDREFRSSWRRHRDEKHKLDGVIHFQQKSIGRVPGTYSKVYP